MNSKVIKTYGIDEAPNCLGQVVVIDVIRAFTTAAFAFSSGVKEIFLVGTAEEAFSLRQKNPDFLIAGEHGGRKIEGFDFGNSPEAISKIDLSGRTLVLRSSSGTQGVVSAKRADNIFLGSLVVAKSTVDHLKTRQKFPVTFLAMGSPNGPDKDEDIACADYMAALFKDQPIDVESIRRRVIECPAGQQALDPKIDYKSPGDLDCATSFNKFDFVMPVFREGVHLIARAEH